MISVGVAAERLRDEVCLYNINQLRYVKGKIEVHVGYWAWRELRKMSVEEAEEKRQDTADVIRKFSQDQIYRRLA